VAKKSLIYSLVCSISGICADVVGRGLVQGRSHGGNCRPKKKKKYYHPVVTSEILFGIIATIGVINYAARMVRTNTFFGH